ncbi:DNA primase [uncultured Bartonella sp.]|uniref:DNA primase n=1 Tax=uncultured Bartonella sp. TaxID=104108 RepID=UPI0025F8AA97|nr:DNA primase [uncultured Bartonella sp.]
MRFSPDFLDEIRARLPISTVVGQRVNFDPKKSNVSRGDFWGCCPFHGEKTPSFHCEDRKGRYHCFGCGVSGDIFTFVTEIDGIPFPEAVERLANQAGVQMPARDKDAERQEKIKKDLYDVMNLASAFFQSKLKSQEGNLARSYLEERQMPKAMMDRFHIGFSPDSRNALKDALIARDISLKQMEECGLVVATEDGTTPYDRFRNRIMFPIADLRGRIVAFGGRAMDKNVRAKYLNSPETVLFHKGKMLYNAATARKAAQPKAQEAAKPIYVVEGYMDVIAMAKAGVDTAVAPLGTALTEDQIALLWRMTPDPVFCFDGDEAGVHAAFRAAERILPILKAGVSARFILLPDGKDPDDIVKNGGSDSLKVELSKSIPLAELLWRKYTFGQQFETPEARAALEREIKSVIFTIKDESLRHYYLQDLRDRLRNLFRPAFFKNNGKNGTNYRGNRSANTIGGGPSPSLANSNLVKNSASFIPLREAAILMTLASHPELWYEDFETLAKLELQNPALIGLHRAMLEIMGEWQPNDADAMMKLLKQKGQEQILNRIHGMLKNLGFRCAFAEAPIEDAREALKQAVYLHLRAHNLHKRLRDIEAELLEKSDSGMFTLLGDVKAELEKTEAVEALIDGFGQWKEDESGRNESENQ